MSRFRWLMSRFRWLMSRFRCHLSKDNRLRHSLRNNSRRSVTKTGVGALVPDQPPQQAPEAEGQNSTHKGDHRTRHH